METNHYLKYKTQPLGCWQKAKELRYNFYKSFHTAREEGKLITLGGSLMTNALTAGLGEVVHLGGEAYAASVGAEEEFSRQCAEEVEARGYARDMCGYMREYWGSAFLDKYLFGGPFPKPDFVIQRSICDSQGKWFQVMAEYFGVPYFGFDLGAATACGMRSNTNKQDWRNYVVGQLHDAIEWLEKVTGRKYDDGRLIEAVKTEYETMALWAEICSLTKAIPCPVDLKSIYSLAVPTIEMRHTKEALEFNRLLRDEVEDRVANQIAALATERCRLIQTEPPPWHFLKLFRYVENYGAVFVASEFTHFKFGNWDTSPDKPLGRARPLEERGIQVKNREQALRLIATMIEENPDLNGFNFPQDRGPQLLRMMREWQADAMVLHLNRGCEGMSFGQMENRLTLLKAGYPVLTYEGNFADKREFDEAQTLDHIDAFMEGLGFSRLPLAAHSGLASAAVGS